MRRYAARRDENEPDIVKALEGVGAKAQPLDPGAGGVPDLLVGYQGETYLIEVKNPETRKFKPGHAGAGGKTAQRQADFRAAWPGRPVAVVETPEQALAAIGARPA